MIPEQIAFVAEKFALPLLVIIVGLLCWYPSILLNKRLLRKHPEYRPFAWGYFNSLMLFAFGAISAALGFSKYFSYYKDNSQSAEIGVLLIVLGTFVFLRNRWVWIVFIISNMNPVAWIINGIYLKNRWQEMRMKSLSPRWRKLSTTTRAIVAGSSFWMTCVFAFVALFKPYGRVRDDDVIHMFAVIIVPPLLAGFAIFLWRRVKEPEIQNEPETES